MINPIKERLESDAPIKQTNITEEVFSELIKEIYTVMLDYSRIRRKMLTHDNPIQIGNVIFWFESNKDLTEYSIKFNNSVTVWNEKAIRTDILLHLHDLYYGS